MPLHDIDMYLIFTPFRYLALVNGLCQLKQKSKDNITHKYISYKLHHQYYEDSFEILS